MVYTLGLEQDTHKVTLLTIPFPGLNLIPLRLIIDSPFLVVIPIHGSIRSSKAGTAPNLITISMKRNGNGVHASAKNAGIEDFQSMPRRPYIEPAKSGKAAPNTERNTELAASTDAACIVYVSMR